MTAATQAQTLTAAGLSNTVGAGTGTTGTTHGWEFHVNVQIVVTKLGIFDTSQDGLTHDHLLGIFHSSGTLLGSTTVLSGTASPLTAQFRYEPLAVPLVLPVGNYTVAAFEPNRMVLFPSVPYVGARAQLSGFFETPTSPQPVDRFGPNFQFTTAPEIGPTLPAGPVFACFPLGLAVRRRKLRPA